MAAPWMRSVILTSANTNYNLHTLLLAVDSQVKRRVQTFQIQLDVNSGAARLYIGNSSTATGSNTAMSATNCGVELVASQAFSIPSLDSNLAMLSDVAVRSDTAGVRINVVLLTR